MKIVWQSIRMLAVLSVLTGLVYPLVMTGISQKLFPKRANGSIINLDGVPVGSELIGQVFASDRYFWPRPSAVGYNPSPSGGSNLGPTSNLLKKTIYDRRTQLASVNSATSSVPPDLLCASASGLDPHISPVAAHYQIERVIRGRNLDLATKNVFLNIIDELTEPPTLGFLGEPRINVLKLNLTIDSMFKARE